MNTVTIYLKDLKAVAHAMALKDVRYYLNGVCVEVEARATRLVASDGHRFHIVIDNEHPGVDRVTGQYILSNTLVNKILKNKVSKFVRMPEIVLDFNDNIVTVTMPDGSKLIESLVDGKYPDYNRLMPDNESVGDVIPAHYQPKYIADAYDGLNDYLDNSKSTISRIPFYQRGLDVGLLISGNYMVAIMPIRADNYTADTSLFKKG